MQADSENAFGKPLMFFDFDGFNLFMLPFTDAMRSAKGNDCHNQQAFDRAAT